MRIGIIGGGMMGLALGHRLSGRGHNVTILERETQLGGLATYHNFGPFVWDRFYHVILPTDSHLIGLLHDIDLTDRLRWRHTRTGFYVDQKLHSISSSMEFLRFPAISLFGKIRMALTILYCARINDWKRLESLLLEPWLMRLSGRATYEKFWKPLLLAKLGENYRRVSAVFIWSYIKRLYSARASAAQREQLGHVSGGYRTVILRLAELIQNAGGAIETGVTVTRVAANPDGGIQVDTDRGSSHFDKVVFTGPVNILERIVAPELVSLERRGATVEYLGVICMVLITRKPLVPFYVVNIADPRIAFTGVIGMSNVVATEETAGLHLTYLPKYVHSDDPILRESDEALRKLFLDGVHLMFPELREEDVVSTQINRAVKVQPLQVLNYSELVPQVSTRHDDFFVLNTSQFVHNTLNNNEVVRSVNDFLASHGEQFAQPGSYSPTSANVAASA